MTSFPIHTVETAPEGSRDTLRQVERTIGFIPNLAGLMAGSPTLLRGFFTLREIYAAGSLTGREIQVLSITNARENTSAWCVAFHSLMAGKEGVPEPVIQALRQGEAIPDGKLNALSNLTRSLIRNRGRAGQVELDEFYAAGYSPSQALEVVLGIAFSTMANFAALFAPVPLEQVFQDYEWFEDGSAVGR